MSLRVAPNPQKKHLTYKTKELRISNYQRSSSQIELLQVR